MNKLLPLFAFAILLLSSCAKDETATAVLDNDQVTENSEFGWVFNTAAETPTWEAMTEEIPTSDAALEISTRSNSAHTHGDYEYASASITMEWSGTENNGGPHGAAIFTQTLNLPFPPFTADLEVTMETECVMVDGNEAVYGGIMTEVLNSPFPPGGPFEVGNHMIFKVIDNGQGNGAPLDQFNTGILISPSFASFCGAFTPSHPVWSLPFFSTLDVQAPGSVKVND